MSRFAFSTTPTTILFTTYSLSHPFDYSTALHTTAPQDGRSSSCWIRHIYRSVDVRSAPLHCCRAECERCCAYCRYVLHLSKLLHCIVFESHSHHHSFYCPRRSSKCHRSPTDDYRNTLCWLLHQDWFPPNRCQLGALLFTFSLDLRGDTNACFRHALILL